MIMYALSSSLSTQIPLSMTELMVVKSDAQLTYLARNTDLKSLRVLLLDNVVFEAAGAGGELILQQVLQNIAATSKYLAWLRLPCANTTPLTHSAAAQIQSLHTVRALECVKWCKLTELDVRGLVELQFLDLHECDSITRLVVNGLTQLQYLYLHMCTNLNTVEGVNELKVLKHLNLSETNAAASALAALGELTKLEQLTLNIASDSDNSPQPLSSTSLSALKSLMLLQHLDLSYSSRITTVEVTGLTCIQYLNLSSCSSLRALTGIDTLTALQYLHLRSCSSLCSELNLTGLNQLQLLNLGDCDMLTDVQGIDTLVSLRKLTLDQCSKLSTALDLTRLTALKYVSLHGCTSLQSVTGIAQLPSLSSLDLCDCSAVSLPNESVITVTLAALRTLEVNLPSILSYFQKLMLPALKELIVKHNEPITTVDCNSWPSLTALILRECSTLTTLQGLERLELLEKLNVRQCPQLKYIPELTCLKTLTNISIRECANLNSMYNKFNLTDFESLSYLNVSGSGIGRAIMDRTDAVLEAQVLALQKRAGFQYIYYDGATHVGLVA
jgi:hypothetical protein